MDADGLSVAHIEEVRIGCGELRVEVPSDLGGDAGSEADSAARAVVVPRSEQSGGGRGRLAEIHWIEQVQLGEVEHSLLLVGPNDADHVVEHLGDADHGEA